MAASRSTAMEDGENNNLKSKKKNYKIIIGSLWCRDLNTLILTATLS